MRDIMEKRQGSLTVVSGFSGAGKGTIMKKLLKKYDNYALSVSMTTRSPRPGEEHGREYFFVSREEFDRTIRENGFLEHAEYAGKCYGTPRKYVEEQIAEGKDVILEIEVQGGKQIREVYPDAILIFVTTPNAEILRQRLTGRGSEDAKAVERRLREAVREAGIIRDYDYLLVNDDLDEAVERIHEMIRTAKTRPSAMKAFTEQFEQELRQMTR